jgi:hypothetical protein
MALIIEDGSIVVGAESYATAAELVVYAANFSKTIPTDAAVQEALLRRAALQMDAICWKGNAVTRDQPLSWPRYNMVRHGWPLPLNVIPPQVKAGQMALATEIYADDLVDPNTKSGAITKKVVGPLEFDYAPASPIITKPASVRQSYAQFTGLVEPTGQLKLSRS